MGTNTSLVKFTGEGHSQILQSKCVNAVASDTFRFLEIPKSGFTCDVNKPVLKPIWWSNIPPNAMPGKKLDSKVMAPLIDLKETDAYAEFRAVPGDIDTVFSRIFDEFKTAKYKTNCDQKFTPLTESCYFWEAEGDSIGISVYTEQDVRDSGLVAPDGRYRQE